MNNIKPGFNPIDLLLACLSPAWLKITQYENNIQEEILKIRIIIIIVIFGHYAHENCKANPGSFYPINIFSLRGFLRICLNYYTDYGYIDSFESYIYTAQVLYLNLVYYSLICKHLSFLVFEKYQRYFSIISEWSLNLTEASCQKTNLDNR